MLNIEVVIQNRIRSYYNSFHQCHLRDKNRVGDICVIESSTINFSEDQTETEGDIYQGYCELF